VKVVEGAPGKGTSGLRGKKEITSKLQFEEDRNWVKGMGVDDVKRKN